MGFWDLGSYLGGKKRTALMAALLVTTALGAYPAAGISQAMAQAQTSFSIPAGSLSQSLKSFGHQAGLQVSYLSSAALSKKSPGLNGSFSKEEALARLLDGTGLTYFFADPTSVTIADPEIGVATSTNETKLPTIIVLGNDKDAKSGSGFRGTPDWVYRTGDSVSVISDEAIKNSPPRNTADIFRMTAGVEAVSSPQSPGVTVNVRGLQDQGRVTTMIDGARQTFQQSGHGETSYTFIDPALLRTVQIEKSGNSGVGHAGSLGGAVNFRTITADDLIESDKDFGGFLNLTSGTNKYRFSGSGGVGVRISDSFSVVGALSTKNLGQYKVGKNGVIKDSSGKVFDDPEYASPVFTGSETLSGLVKAEAALTDDLSLTLSWQGYQGQFSEGSVSLQNDKVLENHTLVADLAYNPDNPLIDAKAKLWFNKTRNNENRQARSSYGAFNVDYDMSTIGGSFENTSRFEFEPVSFNLNYGLEALREKSNTRADGDTETAATSASWFAGPNPVGERTVVSGFSNLEVDLQEWLTLNGGLRYDHYSLSGTSDVAVRMPGVTTCVTDPDAPAKLAKLHADLAAAASIPPPFGPLIRADLQNQIDNFVPAQICTTGAPFDEYFPQTVKNSGGKLLPTASVTIAPMDGLQLFGKYSQGYRPPTIMESVLGGQHIGGIGNFGPNALLKPEESQTWEIGANLSLNNLLIEDDALRMKAVAYYRSIKNYIGMGTVNITPAPGIASQSYQANVNLDGITRMKGLEVEASYDAGMAYGGISTAFTSTEFSDTYTINGMSTAATILETFTPPKLSMRLDAGVRLFDRKLTLGGRMNMVQVGKRTNSAGFTSVSTEDYTLFDLYGSYRFNDHATLRFAVDNLTDKAYVPVLGSTTHPAAGRTATLSMNLTF